MILIVDDHLEIGIAMCRLLSRAGYPASHLSSAKDALQFISSFDLDNPLLIVLDDMMPAMSGLELLQNLRASPHFRRVPVVMFSAGYDGQRRDAAESLGILDWVVKGRDANATINTFIKYYENAGGTKEIPPAGSGTDSANLYFRPM